MFRRLLVALVFAYIGICLHTVLLRQATAGSLFRAFLAPAFLILLLIGCVLVFLHAGPGLLRLGLTALVFGAFGYLLAGEEIFRRGWGHCSIPPIAVFSLGLALVITPDFPVPVKKRSGA